MVTAQVGHTAILLPNGKVLIAGGVTVYPTAAPAEVYDLSTGTFAPTGAYAGTGLCDFCPPAVLLPNGSVLFAGQSPAQLYDPVSGTFSLTGAMADPDHSTATLLMNGKVLFAGGVSVARSSTAELYDSAAGTFGFTGHMASRRAWHTATLLPDGTA